MPRQAIGRRVFLLAETGLTLSTIARSLAGDWLVRRNGKPWTQRQVAAILARAAFYRDGALRYGEINGENKALALVPRAE